MSIFVRLTNRKQFRSISMEKSKGIVEIKTFPMDVHSAFSFLQSSRALSREKARHWLVRSHVLVITPDTSRPARGIFLINKTSRRTFCRSNGPLFVPFLFPLSRQLSLGNPFASPSQHADISFDSVNTCPVVGDVETPTVPFFLPFFSREFTLFFLSVFLRVFLLFYSSSFPSFSSSSFVSTLSYKNLNFDPVSSRRINLLFLFVSLSRLYALFLAIVFLFSYSRSFNLDPRSGG